MPLPNTSPGSPTTGADALSLLPKMLPPFLRALNALADGQGDAGEVTHSVLDQFTPHAEEGDEESRALWAAAAGVARRVLAERPGPYPLIDDVEQWEERPGTGWQAICALSYLGASADPRTLPTLAIALHMTVAEFLYEQTSQNTELYEGVILPWFTNYWNRVFTNARFRFQAPRVVESGIATALESPPQERLQRLLGTIGLGLGVALPDEGQNWFHVSR